MVFQSFATRAQNRRSLGVAAAALAVLALGPGPARGDDRINFALARTEGLPAGCAPGARGTVTVETLGFAERLTVSLRGFPPNTNLELFTLQAPNFPFGVGWYVGDLNLGPDGAVTRSFVSRFSEGTFALGVGEAGIPTAHAGDQTGRNPTFGPIHTFHVGLWFDTPADARRAGCPAFATPFNGDHTAGPQVLNSGTFPDRNGPLRRIDD